ncbi:flavin-containing monooxygenase [Georgenia sp. Z1491]|uniref:flavin-containing monooxygenase n=1 Tax=Georgenia sp. Z1491 TaxID=3416707 RepID=UPI003CE781EE
MRGLALDALRQLRDGPCSALDMRDAGTAQHLFDFLTGPADDDYTDLLAHEFAYPGDAGAPTWTVSDFGERRLSALVIGAGLSGLSCAHRLHQAGVDVTVVEKNSDVGGSWHENTYPGCRLDTTNFGYSFTFAQTQLWPTQYSTQPAIYSYFRNVADRRGLRELITFDTTVSSLDFDDSTKKWTARLVDSAGRTSTLTTDLVVSATGQLNQPNIPDIPGSDNFSGPRWHTARWRHDVDVGRRRVGVIGTGASAFQAIPELASSSPAVIVFQRTPPWLLPAPDYRQRIAPGMTWLLRHVPHYYRWYRLFQFWTTVEGRRPYVEVDPTWTGTDSVSAKNNELREVLTGYLENQFGARPDLLPAVTPSYPPGAKRMLRDDGAWAETLSKSHVELVTAPIERLEPDGVRTSDGVLHEVDVLVYGTGFKASEFLGSLTVTGRDGRDLHAYWDGDARAFHGITVPGFPNLFCLYGPNTNLVVNGSILLFSELAVNVVLEAARALLEGDHRTVEVREGPYLRHNEELDRANALMAWGASEVSSWYKNARGRVTQNWPYRTLDYWRATRVVDAEHYEFD